MIWYSCSRNHADPIFIVTLSFSKRTEHLMEHSASLIRDHPFCYQTIHSMWVTVPWCVLLMPLAATGHRCPETARQTAGIVLDPSPLISQSKKGFPVSELQARQDAEGVCATFPFSRNPNLLRYHVGEGRSGSPRPMCLELTHTDPCQGNWSYGLCHYGKTLCWRNWLLWVQTVK